MKDNVKIALYGIKYICHDCNFIFSIFTKLGRNKKAFCPSCGEYWETERFTPTPPDPDGKLLMWTKQEEDMLKHCFNGDITVTQMAVMLGRTKWSVAKKLQRMREKMNV